MFIYIDYWFLFIHVYIYIDMCVHRWYLYIASTSTFTSLFGAFGQAFRTEDGHKIRNSSEAWSWYGTCHHVGVVFNTCFLGVPCHQPSTNKWVLLGLRVEGYPIIHEVSHVFWNFHLAKLGKWNPIWRSHVFQVGGKKPPPVRPEILRFWTRVRLRTCIASMDLNLKLETFQLKPHIFMRS